MPRPPREPFAPRYPFEITWPDGRQPNSRFVVLPTGSQHLFNSSVRDPKKPDCRTKTLSITRDEALALERDGYVLDPSPSAPPEPKTEQPTKAKPKTATTTPATPVEEI